MKNYSCTFTFCTTVQTHGRDEQGAIDNIDKFINKDVIQTLEETLGCGIDYDRDGVEAKEIENGWFELTLKWYGGWDLDSKYECEAIREGIKNLDERLTPFYQAMENMSTKNRRFAFIKLDQEAIDGIYGYQEGIC